MQALEAILTRVTCPPVKMTEPGPDDAAIARLINAAAAAPDHGKLRPWRFLVVRGDSRERLGRLFAEALREEAPDSPDEAVQKQAAAPLRAPVLIIAVQRLQPDHPKIPVAEQSASAAAAVQNLLLAAHAMGYAGKWSTGASAYSPRVKAGLGLDESESIMGIVYLGAAAVPQPIPPRPEAGEITREWFAEP